jgi:hypothetical protein
MSHEPLELGRYADLCATLHHYRAEAESAVLEASGVSPDEWAVSDAHWTEQLSEAYRRRNETAAYEFATRYAKMRRRLARHGVPVSEALATLITRPKPKADAASAEARDGAASTSQIPTYLLEQQQRAASGAALAAPPAAMPSAPPAAPARAPATPGPAAGGAEPMRLPASAGGHVAPGGHGGQPLPAVAPKPAFAQGTAMAFEAPRQALPFREGVASPAVASPPPPAAAAPKTGGPGTGTAFLPDPRDVPPPSIAPMSVAADQARPAGPPSEPMPMTVEHYAAMVAELHGKPGQDEAVLRRYGIQTAEERARVQRTMTAHLRADPSLRAKYEALLQRFAAWMR